MIARSIFLAVLIGAAFFTRSWVMASDAGDLACGTEALAFQLARFQVDEDSAADQRLLVLCEVERVGFICAALGLNGCSVAQARSVGGEEEVIYQVMPAAGKDMNGLELVWSAVVASLEAPGPEKAVILVPVRDAAESADCCLIVPAEWAQKHIAEPSIDGVCLVPGDRPLRDLWSLLNAMELYNKEAEGLPCVPRGSYGQITKLRVCGFQPLASETSVRVVETVFPVCSKKGTVVCSEPADHAGDVLGRFKVIVSALTPLLQVGRWGML